MDVNDVDHEVVMVKIRAHDPDLERFGEGTQHMYRDVVQYFCPAMNLAEETEYDAVSTETYLILTKRNLYCVDLDTLEWLFDPIPVENIGAIQLSLNNSMIAIFKRR